jgi:hypothetical protein
LVRGLRCPRFDRPFLPGSFLGGGRFGLFTFRPDCRPTLFGGDADRLPTSFAELPFGLRDFGCGLGWCLRLAFARGPTPLLGFLHPPSSGRTEFLALPRGNFWRRDGFSGTAVKHLPKLGDLAVDALLLRLEAFDGSGDDITCEFCRHGFGFRCRTANSTFYRVSAPPVRLFTFTLLVSQPCPLLLTRLPQASVAPASVAPVTKTARSMIIEKHPREESTGTGTACRKNSRMASLISTPPRHLP